MMNGSRSNTPRHGERPSLDALNRTIEGLEQRIGDLMNSANKVAHPDPQSDRGRSSQLSEILDRQKLIEQDRQSQPAKPAGPSLASQIRERLRAPAAQGAQTQYAAAPQQRAQVHEPQARQTGGAFDIAEALVNLRKDLKNDLTQSFGREIADLRREMQAIGGIASNQGFVNEVHADLQRLAAGIEHLGQASGDSAVRALQAEFDSLRSLIGGLASQEDLDLIASHIPAQGGGGFDSDAIRDEILHLAARIDDMKAQLHDLNAEPALHALEAKLVTIAEAIEMFATQGAGKASDLTPQISALDRRLDDIAAAISANGPSFDGDAGLGSLEERISRLAAQIEQIAIPKFENNINARIEGLSERIEELGYSQAAARLEQRLDDLAEMMDHLQRPAQQPELTGYLSDISRKIDALDSQSVSGELIARFDSLARRIDELEAAPPQAFGGHDDAFLRLEERMQDIATRLDEAAAPHEPHLVDLSGLEAQIANLSALLNQPNGAASADMSGFENRMAALEEYLATNDEYIVEAARQAAENALEAYTRNYGGHASTGGNATPADLSVISDLAADLRALEDLTRAGEQRNQRTFEALQDTLLQIAERIDRLGEPAHAAEQAVSASAQSYSPPMPAAKYEPEPFDAHVADHRAEFRSDAVTAELQAEIEDAPLGHEREPENKSLFVSLGKKLMPGRKDDEALPRQTIDRAPAIDAADDINPELANQLLEPGSGAPDISKILDKVRASQSARDGGQNRAGSGEADNADYIAAARRAAQAAAAEMTADGTDAESSTKDRGLSRYRRPLLLAVGAVLLAVMAYPLAQNILGGSRAPLAVKPAAVTNSDKAAPVSTPSAKPPATPAKNSSTSETAAPAPAASTGAATTAAPSASPAEPTQPAAPEVNKPAAQPAANGSVSNTQPAADKAAAPAQAELTVPAGITPPALATAAEQNDPLAVYEVGSRLAEGRGVAPDANAARAWFEKAAQLGFAPAEYRLGTIYEKGIGVKADVAKATSYYLAAAQAGNVSAMHNLAVLYATAPSGTPDFKSAAKWFQDAANHGVRDSQFNLAILYAKGTGVTQDLEKSYEWFGIAAKSGDSDAAQKRDEVGKVLTGEQLKAGKAAVDKWVVTPPDNHANSTIIPDAWAGKGKKTSSIDMKKAIHNIQAILDKNGFDAGVPDGVMGEKTIAAIKSFQKSVGQEPTGEVDEALVRALLARNNQPNKT